MQKKHALLWIGIVLVAGALALGYVLRGSKGSLAKADQYFEEGDYVRALIEYRAVLQADRKSLPAYRRIGAIWLARGNPLEALRYFNTALELDPDDLDLKRDQAEALHQLRHVGALRAVALEILESAPKDEMALLHLARSSGPPEQVEETAAKLDAAGGDPTANLLLARAIVEVRRENFAEAEKHLRQVLELDPKSAAAHESLAALHFRDKDNEKGEDHLRQAAEHASPRSAPPLNYARYLAGSKRADEAVAQVKKVLEAAPDYLPASTLLASLLHNDGKHDEALATLDTVFALDPRNLDAHATKTQILVAQGKLDAAIDSLKNLGDAYSGLPKLKLNLAALYLRNGNVPQAQVTLEEVLKSHPEYTEAELLLAEVNLRTGQDRNETIDRLEKLVEREPKLLQAQLLLSNAYQAAGRFDDAAAIFHKQLEANAEQAGPHYLLGLLHNRQKQPAKAREHFEAAQEHAPDDLNITARLIDLDLADQDHEAAHRRVQRHIQAENNLAAAHLLEGRIFSAGKKWEEAKAALLQSLELNPKSIDAYNALTNCYVATGNLDEAIGTIRTLLNENPKSTLHHLLLGWMFSQKKDHQEAAKALEAAIAVDPDFVPALNDLAYLYTTHLPDLDKALDLAKRARELQPDSPAISDTLGWIYFKLGDYARALPLLEEAAQQSSNPEILYHLGMARYQSGKEELAEQALRSAVEAEPDFPGKEDARKRLAGLGAEALEPLEARLASNPNDLIALTRIAALYAQNGETEKAQASYQKALEINGESLDALIGLARLNLGPLNNLEEASTFARKARSLAANDPRTAELLGRVSLQKQDHPLAYGLLLEAARTQPDDASLQKDLGWAAYFQGHLDQATQAFQQAISLDPESASAAEAQQALALIEPPADGTWKSLAPAAEQRLADDPNHVPALMVRAAVRHEEGDSPGAIAIYESILARLPEFAPVQKRLVPLLAEDPATLDRAYRLGLAARAKLPKDHELARSLAPVAYRHEKFDLAIQLLKELPEPLEPRELFFLGISYSKTANPALARDPLEKALAAGLEEPFATEARTVLASPSPN